MLVVSVYFLKAYKVLILHKEVLLVTRYEIGPKLNPEKSKYTLLPREENAE
jgi:hypothetical protein